MRNHTRLGKAGATLVDRRAAALFRFSIVLTMDAARAESLVTEAFSIRTDSDGGAGTEVRSLRGLASTAYSSWAMNGTTSGVVDPTCAASSATQVMCQLPDGHRAALALCMLGDHTSTQAAAVLGLPTSDVVTLLHEALVTLGRPISPAVSL